MYDVDASVDGRSDRYETGSQFSTRMPSAAGDVDAYSRRGTVAGSQKLYAPPVCRTDIQDFKGANPWSVSCCLAPCSDPIYCLSAQICFPCRIYQQRKQLLSAKGETYTCCAGICGKQYTDPCLLYVRGNESVCLAAEVTLFPCWALYGNRWMVHQHYNIKLEWFDRSLNWMTCPLSIASYLWQDDVVENCVYAPIPLCAGWVLAQQQAHMNLYGYPVGHNVVRREMR